MKREGLWGFIKLDHETREARLIFEPSKSCITKFITLIQLCHEVYVVGEEASVPGR